MKPISRRFFLAGSATTLVSPAFAAVPTGDLDVVIIGAGAAGIAAARRLGAAGRKVAIVEAADRVGGRCFTETTTFGIPYDRGAHWLHAPDVNPVAKLAQSAGLDVYPAPTGQKLRVGRRYAREGELETYLAALVRATRAIGDTGRNPKEVAAAQVMPKDLGEWRPTIDFALGPFTCGKNLEDVSAQDLAHGAERDIEGVCRQGVGAALVKLADGLPIRLSTHATRIVTYGRGVAEVETTKGTLRARAVIVTVSTGVLASGKLRFDPVLPKRQADAIARLSPGIYEHVALEIPGNVLGLENDDLIFDKSDGPRTAALVGNVSGTSLCLVDVAGKFGAGLAAQGEAAMTAFAGDWIADMFGNDVKRAIKRTHATRWAREPLALGAFSAAAPGGQGGRKALMEPIRDRVWFAGEAVHETLWGTVEGAWESGEHVADVVNKRLGRGGRRLPERSAPVRRQRRDAPVARGLFDFGVIRGQGGQERPDRLN
ncbi:MAG: flavin monoamine oxidase family protein [Variibacter sp.]